MRAIFVFTLVLAGCTIPGEPSPWTRATLLAEGADRVEVERREVSTLHDGQTEYRISFSHDGGSHDGGSRPVRAIEGRLENFDRRVRAFRLQDGRLAVAVFSEACVEASSGAVVCSSFTSDKPAPAELRPVLAELARDRAMETYVRAGAATALAGMRAPEAVAVITSMLAEDTAWSNHAVALRAARARLTQE